MILQALCRLAEQEKLIEDPDYEVKPVSWLIRLKADGTLANIEDRRTNLNEGSRRQPKWEGKPTSVPRQSTRTSGAKAFFLVDKSEYVFGFDPAGNRAREDLVERLTLFRDAVAASAEATKDKHLRAIVAFLENVEYHPAAIEKCFKAAPWAVNDLFAFCVGLDEMSHERPAVREYWKSIRNPGAANDETGSFRCLVSGRMVGEPGLFPLLKKVPGGTSSGVSLVSFNAKSFESYGLSGNENAPVSRAAAEEATTALNRLLHEAYPNPQNPGTSLAKRHQKLSADTVACFWAAEKAADVQGFLDFLPDLLAGENESDVGAAYRSIWKGRPADAAIKTPSAFYSLILSGAQGRAVVRDWIETSLAETVDHLAAHFADLDIVHHAHSAEGKPEPPTVPLRWLMSSLAPEGKGDSAPASIEAGFLRAAFTGTQYPFQLLQRALVRSRVESGSQDWTDRARGDARAALIKAVLNRRRRFDPQAQARYPEVTREMKPNHESPGYSLGMLIAVLERLQAISLGDVNASIVDRYFSAASATPRAVFVRLLRNALHHARKASNSDEGPAKAQAFRCSRLIDAIVSRFDVDRRSIPPRTNGLPGHLDLEQQGLFVLGYHQMRYWLWMSNEERAAWEAENPDAPAAFRWRAKEKEPAEVAT